MRAPPLSLRPITGAPTFIAMSMTLQIFCAWRSLKRAAEHGEVLRENIDQPAVDGARPGDDAVARDLLRLHPEVGAIMLDEHVIFFELAGIEQDAEALAGGQPTLGVLRRDALLAAAQPGQFAALLQFLDRRRQSGPPRFGLLKRRLGAVNRETLFRARHVI